MRRVEGREREETVGGKKEKEGLGEKGLGERGEEGEVWGKGGGES